MSTVENRQNNMNKVKGLNTHVIISLNKTRMGLIIREGFDIIIPFMS